MTTVSLHRLVLLYLYVAYRADHHFDPREREAVIALARRWVPDEGAERIVEVVDAAFAITRSAGPKEVDALAQEVGLELTPDERLRVLADLGKIARADGYLSTGEAGVISRIRTVWAGL